MKSEIVRLVKVIAEETPLRAIPSIVKSLMTESVISRVETKESTTKDSLWIWVEDFMAREANMSWN